MEIDDFKRKGPSLWSFMLMGIIGAAIGAILTLTFAPITLFEGLDNEEAVEAASIPKDSTSSYSTDMSYACRTALRSMVQICVEDGNKELKSAGTGIIVDSSGLILTGASIGKDKDIHVKIDDNSTADGTVVWEDKSLGVAVIKVDSSGLQAAALGDASKMELGMSVVTVQSLTGKNVQESAHWGIISSLDCTTKDDKNTSLTGLLRVDWTSSGNAVKRGNPVVNSSGEIIGLNMASDEDNKGFVIPISLLKSVVNTISLNGEFTEPDLGIEGIDSSDASNYDKDIDEGIVIHKITLEGAAEAAGLSEGDIILAVNSNPVNTLMELKEQLYMIGAGNDAILKVIFTDGKTDYVKVELNAHP